MMPLSRVWLGFGTSCFLLILIAGLIQAQEITGREVATAVVTPAATPTIDRLAAPPTVPSPTQADEGAQIFWMWCQPCHGDQGQGLTDEWRAQYPSEDQNCWNSGCHGKNPYEEGFTLPQFVPAVIGEFALARFQTTGELYEYIRASMPYEYPAVLDDEEYLALTAFLVRAHDKWDGTHLTSENVAQFRLRPLPAPTTTPTSTPMATKSPPTPDSTQVNNLPLVGAGVLFVLVIMGGLWLWKSNGR